MRRVDPSALTEEVARFQTDLRRLALEIAHAVIRRELDGRRTEREPVRRPGRPKAQPTRLQKARPTRLQKGQPIKRQKGRPIKRQKARPIKRQKARSTKRQKARPAKRQKARSASRQLELLPAAAPVSAPAIAVIAPAPPAAAERPPTPSAIPGKRRRWTRDAVIEELARWMVSGTLIDAGFVTRHGPPGLAAAARRIFGRFEAALNVASLQVTRLYPDGAPGAAGHRQQTAAPPSSGS